MRNNRKLINRRIVIILLVVLVIMSVIGALMTIKLRSLLRSYMETQVSEQAKTLATIPSEEFAEELQRLENASGKITDNSEMNRLVLSSFCESMNGIKTGILALDGTAVEGDTLSFSSFKGIQDSFRGNSSVCYNSEQGILFTAPVRNGDNVKYVLYKLYDNQALLEQFGMTAYNDNADIMLIDRESQIVMPFCNPENSSAQFLENAVIREALGKLYEKLNINTAAAIFCKNYRNDESYVFVSEVSGAKFYLIGVVSEEAVSNSINTITVLVIWVIGLLMVLFAVGIVYLLSAEEKARESDELREAIIMVEQANNAKTNFLANMSHEIRTPINAIVGMNEMVLRETKENEIKGYALNIQSASRTLLALINDILDFSKIEAGRMEIVPMPYKTNSFLFDVVNMIGVKAKQKDLEFLVDVSEELPAEVEGDEVRIRQVLLNLLNNAVKYTKAGFVKLKVDGIMQENGFCFRMEVSDSGIGIKKEDIGKLFNDFQRLELEKNRNIEGTGLGLAITNKLVKQMDGELSVESEYGKGSIFTAVIPQKIINAEPMGELKDHLSTGEERNEVRKLYAPDAEVLVVDDNFMNLEVVKALLKETKIKITTCMSGRECLKLVQEKHFDVILLDHMMPEMDGVETLGHLKESEHLCNEVPVIALTANAISGAKESYLSAGFTNYLSKPIDSNELNRMLLEYIPADKVRDEAEEQKAETTKTEEPKEMPESAPKAESAAEDKNNAAGQEEESVILVDKGLKYCSNSMDLYKEILEIYIESFEENKETLTNTMNQEDWKLFSVTAHSLKSNSFTIGADRLGELAKKLEFAGKAIMKNEEEEENKALIRESLPEVIRLYEITVGEAKNIAASEK